MKLQTSILLIISAICLSVAAYFGYKMSILRFWGHDPLYLLLGAWTGLVLLVRALRPSQTKDLYFLGLSFATGILLGKAFVYTSPMLFIGFVPMIILQHQMESGSAKRKTWYQWSYAFNAFMVWNICSTYWVANAALFPAIVAFLLNSFFMSIPWLGAILLGRRYPKLKTLSFISFWICFEWVHHNWEISWPWLTLGNGLAFYPKMIQWYDITGVYGGSLWILIVNILVSGILLKSLNKWKGLIAVLTLLAIPIIISYYKYNTFKAKGKSIEVGIVQPNYEPHYQKFEVEPQIQMVQFEKLSRAAITPNTKYLIWPETSFEYIDINEFDRDWRILRMKEQASMYRDLCLVTGIGSIRGFKSGEILTDAARENTRGGLPKYFEVQNSAIQICEGATDIQLYVKSKLVPGVETFPYRTLLPFLKPVVDKLGGSVHGLGKQKERTVFDNGYTKVAPVICYESIYGDYIGDYIRNGAEAIFIMTNDGWWDNTPGYRQHLAFGTLRAIEFRRAIARSANTGISCFVDAKGDTSFETPYGKSASITSNMTFSIQKTIYQQIGDVIAYFFIFCTFALLLFTIIKFLIARFSGNQLRELQ